MSRDLGVHYVLKGTIQKGEDRIQENTTVERLTEDSAGLMFKLYAPSALRALRALLLAYGKQRGAETNPHVLTKRTPA